MERGSNGEPNWHRCYMVGLLSLGWVKTATQISNYLTQTLRSLNQLQMCMSAVVEFICHRIPLTEAYRSLLLLMYDPPFHGTRGILVRRMVPLLAWCILTLCLSIRISVRRANALTI